MPRTGVSADWTMTESDVVPAAHRAGIESVHVTWGRVMMAPLKTTWTSRSWSCAGSVAEMRRTLVWPSVTFSVIVVTCRPAASNPLMVMEGDDPERSAAAVTGAAGMAGALRTTWATPCRGCHAPVASRTPEPLSERRNDWAGVSTLPTTAEAGMKLCGPGPHAPAAS